MEIFDGINAVAGNSSQRRRIAEWMSEHDRPIKTYLLGIVFVVPSALVRSALTAILWVQPVPCPHYITSSMADAERWAMERALATGLRVPPARRRRAEDA